MRELTIPGAVEPVLAVFTEALVGPRKDGGCFLDPSSDHGLFALLQTASAADVSCLVGGTTVAAHVHHLTFGLKASSAWLRGERGPHDWTQTWLISMVDETAWPHHQEDLRRAAEEFRQMVALHVGKSPQTFGGMIAAVAHVVYHLGMIREKLFGTSRAPA